MRLRTAVFPTLRIFGIALFVLPVIALAFVQFEQCLLRHRATRLLADFHSLHLKHSTWPDAQRLISRWGAFGHYEGTCTASECSYFITLEDEEAKIDAVLYEFMEARWPQSYSGITLSRVFRAFGGKNASLKMGLLIEDGLLQRSSIEAQLAVPGDDFWCEWNCGYGLILRAQAKDHLIAYEGEWHIMGDEEQIAKHPEFKAGRPDGCEICMEASVAFTPNIDERELKRITSYNMSCFAGFHICRTLSEVLPAEADWQLYRDSPSNRSDYESALSQPCKVPVFALARDASAVLLVDAISTQVIPGRKGSDFPDDREQQKATVRLIRILKGTSTPQIGALFEVVPFSVIRAEDLEPGKRYVLFPEGWPSAGTTQTPHCGVFEDSPEIEAEIKRGIALNDHIETKQTVVAQLWNPQLRRRRQLN